MKRFPWAQIALNAAVFTLATGTVLAGPVVEIPAEVKAEPGAWVVVAPKTDAKSVVYVGLDGLAAFPSSELKDPRKLVVNPSKVGRFRFVAVGTLGDEQTATAFTIVVGNVPPGPGPGPNPDPGPNPEPSDPAPIAGDGLKVLIMFETAEAAKYTRDQQLILAPAKQVADFLNSQCVEDSKGKKAWRIWDKDVDAENADPAFKDALAKARPTSLPWVLISNGKTGYAGPLPANPSTFIDLVSKYKPQRNINKGKQ